MFLWRKPKKSKFGRFLDDEGITQVDFAEKSNISRKTVWKLCNEKNYIPSSSVLKKIMITAKKIDNSKNATDFFDI